MVGGTARPGAQLPRSPLPCQTRAVGPTVHVSAKCCTWHTLGALAMPAHLAGTPFDHHHNPMSLERLLLNLNHRDMKELESGRGGI